MRPARAALALLLVPALAGPLAGTVAASPGHHAHPGHHQPRALVVDRDGRDVVVRTSVRGSGEGLLDLTAAAPQADWAAAGRESAVVSVSVDGRYVSDVVVPGAQPLARPLLVGELRPGRHTIRLHFADERSAAGVDRALVSRVRLSTIDRRDPRWLAAHYAPILHGRNLPGYGGVYANATTDTPLVAWHDVLPATTPGHRILQTSYVWSNEDGGTDTARLMARWGRSTDIEWIYRVEVDAQGRRVPGSDTFQAPAHTTTAFRGRYEGTHPVLETCTENNNVCDTASDPMRFSLSNLETLPAGQPREAIMDAHPWTYQVMAAEMRRESRLEATGDPATSAVSDQRDYLYLAITKRTGAATVPGTGLGSVGVGLGVRLKGSSTIYRSDHLGTGGAPDWSIQRDDPAATTVELPAGTTAADVAEIRAYRVVAGVDPGSSVEVSRILRGFLLDRGWLPQRSFVSWQGSATLTPAAPSATLWTASTS